MKGLVVARETARRLAQPDILAHVDADCRVPIMWLKRVERAFERRPSMVALSLSACEKMRRLNAELAELAELAEHAEKSLGIS